MPRRKAKLQIDIKEQVYGMFWDFEWKGSNGIRLRRIRNITSNIFDFPFPLSEKESWFEWIVRVYGVSRRTAKEYVRDAEIMTYQIIERIAEKMD